MVQATWPKIGVTRCHKNTNARKNKKQSNGCDSPTFWPSGASRTVGSEVSASATVWSHKRRGKSCFVRFIDLDLSLSGNKCNHSLILSLIVKNSRDFHNLWATFFYWNRLSNKTWRFWVRTFGIWVTQDRIAVWIRILFQWKNLEELRRKTTFVSIFFFFLHQRGNLHKGAVSQRWA